jgi:hypothetical protein
MTFEPVNHSADGDGLQTDVMRFMAIIAFCLIAVLALVKNAEPGVDPQPAPSVQQPVGMAPASELAAPRVEPRAVVSPARRDPQPPVATGTSQATPADVEDVEKVPGEPADPHGLALRFASERDFLRLVQTGRVRVFAFQADDPGGTALGLGRNLEFVASPPPGRVYELRADTIPSRVAASLARAAGNPGGFSWGVRLPVELEASIRSWIDQGVTGELVIDRYAEVQHVSS